MPLGTGFPARGFGTGRTLRPPSALRRPSAAIRLLRLLRLFAANPPPSVLRRPIRFLRLLRFFAANPPLSVLSRPPSVFRRQPSHPILASFALLCGHPSAVRLRRLSLISRFQLFDPSSILLLSLCTSSVGSVTQSSFRLLRLLRVFAANPSSFVRHTPSALRSLCSLL